MTTGSGLPGEFTSRFSVEAPAPSREGGSLKGFIRYTGKTTRIDGRYFMQCEYVDVEGVGHRAEYPDEVVQAIIRSVAAIKKKSRRDAGQRAAEKQRQKGIVPFETREARAARRTGKHQPDELVEQRPIGVSHELDPQDTDMRGVKD